MVDIDTTELREAERASAQLGTQLEAGSISATDDEVENLRSKIVRQIVMKGLVDSGELVSSWEIQNSGTEWTLRSTAEYSMALEEGASPHPIPNPPQSGGPVSFVPENPAKYDQPTDEQGRVVFDFVIWKPDSDGMATGYDFVSQGQGAWLFRLAQRIGDSLDPFIAAAGFKPTIQ